MAKSLHLFISLFLLLLYVSLQSHSFSHEVDECSLLLDFKNKISTSYSASHDPRSYPKLASWNHNTSEGKSYCCLWDGVECSDKTYGHVIVLDLSSSFLYGTINSTTSLFSLNHLHTLSLADNDFRSSQIPSGIGRLSQLANLNLSLSVFSGLVPKEISQLTQLVSLDLGRNELKMQGFVFRNLVQNLAHNLRELFLSKVNLDSQVPEILTNSSSLRSLALDDCGLHGEFPTSIFHLPKLQLLYLQGNNDLTGYLPMFGSSQLRILVLADTKFHGKVPPSIGNLIHLERLNMHNCSFSGPLPGSVGNLTQLRELDIGSNSMDGHIPSSIVNLTQLQQLDIGSNNMVGQIPASIMNLTHLTHLKIGRNGFIGNLPSLESLSNLTILFLCNNNFDRWKLPDWLGKLNKLTYLQLDAVNLYGEIPSSVFNLTQLETLELFSNQIEGPIPPFPSTMTKLRILDLENNQLKGPIPCSLSDHKNLEAVFLGNNNISGTVEVDIFLSLKKLKVLDLGGNKITLSAVNTSTTTVPKLIMLGLESCNLRVFPDFLRFQDQLESLYLDNNKIDGLIPKWMENTSKETLRLLSFSGNSLTGFEKRSSVVPWVGLWSLDLSNNMLHGSIPVPPPTIIDFRVSKNFLTGEIPPSICELQSLEVLDLSFNNVTGSITPCLKKLTNHLLALNLRSNNFQGTIPNIFTNGSKLHMIDLSENQLEGRLPRSLINCASLQILDVGYNHMEDMFPFWLGALSELQVLIFRSNKFHGTIRIPSKTNSMFQKLRIIDLSYNKFSGDLPYKCFQEWSAMKETESDATYMHTGTNFSTKQISWSRGYSYSMELINKGVNLEYEKIISIFIVVDLSSNKFGGKIPESIGSLSSLRLLNLSNNVLSGVIPSSMGNLTLLEALDLSGNKLSGKIPREVTRLNFLELLNVSYNNLTGAIPQGGQFNTFPINSYMGNLALCGDPLSKKCGNSEASKARAVSPEEDMESDFPSGVDWVVILSGVGSGLVIGLLFGNHLTRRFYDWFLKKIVHWKR